MRSNLQLGDFPSLRFSMYLSLKVLCKMFILSAIQFQDTIMGGLDFHENH